MSYEAAAALADRLDSAIIVGEESIANGVSPSVCSGVELFQNICWASRTEIVDALRNLTPPAPDVTLNKEALGLLDYLWGRAKFHDISIAPKTEADLERVMSALNDTERSG